MTEQAPKLSVQAAPEKITDIFATGEFSEGQQNILCRAMEGQNVIQQDQDALLQVESYDIRDGQAPENALSCCSDSRTTRAQIAAERVGKTLVHRIPGGFLSINGEMTLNGAVFVELVGAYGVKDIVVSQHSGCGAMDAIYTYHMEKGPFHGEENGAAYVRHHKGKSFVKVCEAMKPLVEEVQKNGLNHYEKMGIPLLGDTPTRFKQAMAIQQVLWDHEAVRTMKKEAAAEVRPMNLPEPLGLFQHVMMSRTFAYMPKQKHFVLIPLTDNIKPTLPHVCCGGGKCGNHAPKPA